MSDPFSGGFDPRMFENVPLFRELAKVMSWSGGPVNWDLATQTATALTSDSTAAAGDRDSAEMAQAVRTAELWLDAVTALPAVDGPVRALSDAEWARAASSSEGLGVYVEPIAASMSDNLGKNLPPELAGLGGPMAQAMGSMGAMLYGVQVGTIAGNLAGQLLGTYDLGVPTLDPRTIGTVGDTAQRFADDYGFDRTEFRYWLALREAAHRRMFAGVPWLRSTVAELIGRFAADADLDPTRMLEQLGGLGLDPSDPEALQEALSRPDAFHVEPTTAQKATLERLQALVAFVEGWSDTVVRAAAGDKLTALPRIEEAIRRRRAEKGRGEQLLQQLVGLDLKPADFRLGQEFCNAVVEARGQDGLDRAWQRPEHLPSPAELGDPSRWLVRMAAAEMEGDLDHLEAQLGDLDLGDLDDEDDDAS